MTLPTDDLARLRELWARVQTSEEHEDADALVMFAAEHPDLIERLVTHVKGKADE